MIGAYALIKGAGDGGETAAKQSLAYVQLEKQNERLKEALIRYVGDFDPET